MFDMLVAWIYIIFALVSLGYGTWLMGKKVIDVKTIEGLRKLLRLSGVVVIAGTFAILVMALS